MSRLLVTMAAAVLLASPAHAGSTVRYALIVGNNQGKAPGLQLEPLRHAQAEATRLKKQLLQFANFDEQRIELVLGGGRAAILAAARRLAERRQQDVTAMGDVPALFAFFFTGHGLAGKLLTADDALTGTDISTIVRDIGASLTIGFFDACYAGGLEFDALRGKGVVPTSFNPIAELPREVLDSEGTMWFVSSRPDELSYEDEHFGGLFTHFLTESFTEAQPDGTGVTLQAMWEYARRHTAGHAARYGRSQTPEMIVRNLKAGGPVYFSFPQKRTASLRFHPELAGTFLLIYEQSALVERIVKQAGAAMDVATYDGEVTLRRVDGPGAPSRHLELAPGTSVLVQPQDAEAPLHAPGFGEAPIRSKGELNDLLFTEAGARSVLMAGAAWRYCFVENNTVGATNAAAIDLSLARGRLILGLELGYGYDYKSYTDWSYRLHEFSPRLEAGVGFDLGGARLDLEIVGGPDVGSLRYSDGSGRTPLGAFAGAEAGLEIPIPLRRPWIIAKVSGGAGERWSQGVTQADGRSYHTILPTFLAGLAVPLLER